MFLKGAFQQFQLIELLLSKFRCYSKERHVLVVAIWLSAKIYLRKKKNRAYQFRHITQPKHQIKHVNCDGYYRVGFHHSLFKLLNIISPSTRETLRLRICQWYHSKNWKGKTIHVYPHLVQFKLRLTINVMESSQSSLNGTRCITLWCNLHTFIFL